MKRSDYPQALLTTIGQKDFNKHINPYLSRGKRGPDTKISRYKIFRYILYALHTGCQWNKVPIFRNEITWSAIYQHHLR